jgi:hypothetical protein
LQILRWPRSSIEPQHSSTLLVRAGTTSDGEPRGDSLRLQRGSFRRES